MPGVWCHCQERHGGCDWFHMSTIDSYRPATDEHSARHPEYVDGCEHCWLEARAGMLDAVVMRCPRGTRWEPVPGSDAARVVCGSESFTVTYPRSDGPVEWTGEDVFLRLQRRLVDDFGGDRRRALAVRFWDSVLAA